MFIIECVITEHCDLRCTYCYIDKKVVHMSIDIFDMLIDNIDDILKLYNQSRYHLDFFGGEPLLNFDLIKHAVPILQNDQRCSTFSIISNLLSLDEDKLKFIKDNNINTSFSFDGLWNEFNRPLKDGSSSLKLYEQKKSLIKQLSPHYCKVMVSPASLGTLVENARYLIEDWEISPDFTLVRDNIWTEDNINKFRSEIRQLSDLQIDYIKNKHKRVIIGFYLLYLLDMVFGYKYGKRSFGCFAGHNGLGYMPNGVLYPCARFGTNNEYPIYDVKTKTLFKDNHNMFLDQKHYNPQTFDKCQQCVYYINCNAGCTYSQMKNGWQPLDRICELYKILFDESLYVYNNLKNEQLFKDILFERLKHSNMG